MVVQLVRIPACHAGGRGFESRPLRHLLKPQSKDWGFFTFGENNTTKRQFSWLAVCFKKAACHAGGRGFESRPLRHLYQSGKLTGQGTGFDKQTLFAMDGKSKPHGWVHACLCSMPVFWFSIIKYDHFLT